MKMIDVETASPELRELIAAFFEEDESEMDGFESMKEVEVDHLIDFVAGVMQNRLVDIKNNILDEGTPESLGWIADDAGILKVLREIKMDTASNIGPSFNTSTGLEPTDTNKINEQISTLKYKGAISDGYHTFDELYRHRMVLFSLLCKQFPENAWKSLKHDDGTMFDDYFIVGVTTPEGDYSYHYHIRHWNSFKEVRTLDFAPKWDGHKPEDISRLNSLLRSSRIGMVKCDRCGRKSGGYTVSMMNTDKLCCVCIKVEQLHPKYQEARDAEHAEVVKGNYKYPGLFGGQKWPFGMEKNDETY